MKDGPITSEMRVREVIEQYPQTFEVFRSQGCPDMRKGIFALSARIMKVKWAAKAHKIPLDDLLRDLNAAAEKRNVRAERA
jgi:hypothetical protein